MLVIPLQAVPSQQVSVTLEKQACKINVYQTGTGLYTDLYVNDAAVITGVISEDANRIVRSAYLGFVGDLAYFDTQGNDDPIYTGLGSRFILAYIEPGDLAILGSS